MESEAFMQNARFPKGDDGRAILERMRESHTPVTTWTLELMDPKPDETILDIGCGGGRALRRLSEIVTEGSLYGVDYAETAVESSKEENAEAVAAGKMTILRGSVSDLPFADNTFDKIFSIESYYFWPDLVNDLKEIRRVLKPGGRVFIAADTHGREGLSEETQYYIRILDMTNLSFAEFEQVLKEAGYRNIQVHGLEGTDCICGEGTK